ncbi:MAG TPA: glycosyltransferase, partial [Anaerolineae bacterium]|nr:glycosyltransferase [Anaerolineae bacterium]
LTPENGVHDLIDAFGQIAPHFPQVRLSLIGKTNTATASHADPALRSHYVGNYLEQLHKRIPKHLKKRVNFYKSPSEAELVAHYQACNLVVHAGYGGGYNMSLAEAGACGKPVIGTTALSNADIVRDGETGFTIAPGEVYLLAQAMGILLQDVKEQARMGQNGRVRVKYLFEWEQIATTTLSIYRYLLEPQQTQVMVSPTM